MMMTVEASSNERPVKIPDVVESSVLFPGSLWWGQAGLPGDEI
jgi:hypothetical protein